MPTADEFTGRAIEWLQEKWGEGKECPFCHVAQWTVLLPVDWELRPGIEDQIYKGLRVTAIPVVCSNCGFIAPIDGVTSGLIEPTKKRSDAQSQATP